MEPEEIVTDDEVVEGMPIDGVPDITVERDLVATARRRYGVGGAMMAGGMLAIERALELRPVKEEAPIVVASPTEPVDIDEDGIDVDVDDETWVYAPPQPRSHPQTQVSRRR